MHPSVWIFTIATLSPLPLLVAGGLFGGMWAVMACLYLTLFLFVLDEVTVVAAMDAPPGVEFPAARALSIFLGVLHFPVLGFGVAAISGQFGTVLWEQLAMLFAFGLYFGQVSFSNAHELIHSRNRGPFWLGTLVYSSTLYGHHVTAHRHIHHRYVGTEKDPNTAPKGMNFYRFALRAWAQTARQGLRVENDRQRSRFGRLRPLRHMYLVYCAVALANLTVFTLAWGGVGLTAYVALSIYATAQIILADYVQHYGLIRKSVPEGRAAPVGDELSWNAPHPVSAALMLNAPRHSDHHSHPSKPFETLDIPSEDQAPMLPYSLPTMSTFALFPPIWRRVMDKRVREWV